MLTDQHVTPLANTFVLGRRDCLNRSRTDPDLSTDGAHRYSSSKKQQLVNSITMILFPVWLGHSIAQDGKTRSCSTVSLPRRPRRRISGYG